MLHPRMNAMIENIPSKRLISALNFIVANPNGDDGLVEMARLMRIELHKRYRAGDIYVIARDWNGKDNSNA